MAHYLGVMADLAGRWDASVAQLEQGLRFNLGLDSPPLTAHSRHRLADALLARGADEDRPRALGLLDEAATTASALGMACLERDVAATRARGRGAKVSPS